MFCKACDCVINVVVNRGSTVTNSPSCFRIRSLFPVVLTEKSVVNSLLIPTPKIEDVVVIGLFIKAAVIFTRQGVPQ